MVDMPKNKTKQNQTKPTTQHEQDVIQCQFIKSLTGLNTEFFFFLNGCQGL